MSAPSSATSPPESLGGRYELLAEIASGGMGTVHLARSTGLAGFSRLVAVKRLRPSLADDPDFIAMFLDEARLAGRIRHMNVVATLDVIDDAGEIALVMEYVQGASLSKLWHAMADAGRVASPRIVAAVMSGVLHGLHAAHETRDERGRVLDIVHRDVSPQNILVGSDGVARVFDFGVAKSLAQVHLTRTGGVKGKVAYMPPEQLLGERVTRRTDVYAAAVVTWEMLTGQRLFKGNHEAAVMLAAMEQPIVPPSAVASHVPRELDRVVMRGLERDAALRYATASEMALDLERWGGAASVAQVGAWVERWASPALAERSALLAEIEGASLLRSSERLRLGSADNIPTRPFEVAHAKALVEPRSDVSNVAHVSHVASPPGRPRSPAARARSLFVAAAVLATLAALIASTRFFGAGHGLRAETGSASPGAPSSVLAGPPAPAVTVAPPAPAVTVAPPAPEPPPVAVAAPTSNTTMPERTPGPAPSVSRSPPSAQAATVPKRRPSKACDPPYWIDELRHRHYKPDCI